MPKQKTNKSVFKRVKITGSGKILRKHQLGSGHLKRNKSKGALNRQKKTSEFFKGEGKRLRKVIGL
ncbi:MAG: hypothetical protein ACD_38C00033G0005 [uncultured bacterium]|uniref:Large ribosomal subunit protein bL35 n=1 Tax=Candidatus Daviesbacteria bacterium GW2011_GWC2_40_12 TaxID=1618431 RepID=A0A0G0QUL0_9BACT|nr:MAG: hypothetical protein ACD_38C00033G0005 [uncultured bacterium]KKQ82838.1 MAG: hypothetical protein UT04_C0045G0005 [Candidatus Daviesbacteria bacterium GW2011_GWF2_38_7]KKR16674.1 MAG: hypothetical protein UT45_C0004G0005 [Candidatus Daviesbacteria bacterium GW2011_GWA2_39_33]KKR25140.1 MAG: hypothetical protein UT54_C0006G0005 [Candidatus Daviesbacteria bacterium GW2011_GWB1_39_5]KKR41051.1 MAG: hypothetical protein UT77_C0016G0005 [Candidatus Daviesbacteria bacterium GW2011_GWC2_40_12]